MITTEDINKVKGELEQKVLPNLKSLKINSDFHSWNKASLDILDCVLSLNRKYESFTKPRLEHFNAKNPKCVTVSDLISCIEQYDCDFGEFTYQELNQLKHADRGRIIYDVCKYLEQELSEYKGATESEKLKNWANDVRPGDVYFLGIKGFGLSGFQYLRMRFGANTAKPDVHIVNFVSEAIGRKVSDIQALYILEKLTRQNDYPLRLIDTYIWKQRSGSEM